MSFNEFRMALHAFLNGQQSAFELQLETLNGALEKMSLKKITERHWIFTVILNIRFIT
jgi:hypothetical protein